MMLPRPSLENQRYLTRVMQLVLLGIVSYGVITAEERAILNGGIALLITFLPAMLERNYKIPLDPWLGLWITTAVFLHTLGSAGLYGQIKWWDHLTHALSASLIAGIGYIVVRAVEFHSEEIHLPRRFAFVYLVVVVLAFGGIWELLEFGFDLVDAATGQTMPVSQHGLDDTIRDLMFNSVGGLVVAFFGQVYLTDVAHTLREHFRTTD